eukprot:PITA_32108
MDLGLNIRNWVSSGGLSDHLPIFLELDNGRDKLKGPFKFCSTWLKDASYINMVTDFWKRNPLGERVSVTDGFIHNLAELKKMSRNWAHNKILQEDLELRQIEVEIGLFEQDQGGQYSLEEHKHHISTLYSNQGNILKDREENWRFRSRAIWDGQGSTANTFPQLPSLANSHFKSAFQDTRDSNLAEIIRVSQLFPKCVELEDEEDLVQDVTLDELEASLKWFSKDKSPGLVGWTIEFYLSFFEVIGSDLLSVFEESQTSGRLEAAITSTFIALIPKTDKPTSFDDFRPISLCNCL